MKYAEYVQYLKYLPFNLDELDSILNNAPIGRWAYLVHDRDENSDGTLKDPHLHVEMELNSDQVPANVAKWFRDKPQYIEKAKKKYYAYENMCSYLIHDIPSPDGKYPYPPEDVTANFDFVDFINKIREGVARSERKSSIKSRIDEILSDICDDKIPRLKLDEYLSNLERIKYNKQIEQAYNIRDERKAKEVSRDMNVMYFYGESGTGKTTIAKFVAKSKGYSVFVSGSSNDPLQGYIGQECIILDDVRGSDWKINDLLKFLDNNTNSLVKSRYSNKLMNDCKLIILTSVQNVDDLYKTLRESESEPITQLKRRCFDVVRFTRGTMTFYQYDESIHDYKRVSDSPNPINQLIYLQEHKSMLPDVQKIVSDLNEDKELFNNDDLPF